MDEKSILLGKGLMMIAGADHEITPPELAWLEDSWLCSTEEGSDLYDLLIRFNYREEHFEEFFSILKDKLSEEEKKRFLYDSIKMSSADIIYSDEEKSSVKEVTEIFEVPKETLAMIESLVEMETAVSITRRAILND